MSSGHKLKTKKSQISCSRNYCQNITYYDIKLDESILKKENFNFTHDRSGLTIFKSELRTYSILSEGKIYWLPNNGFMHCSINPFAVTVTVHQSDIESGRGDAALSLIWVIVEVLSTIDLLITVPTNYKIYENTIIINNEIKSVDNNQFNLPHSFNTTNSVLR